MHERLDRSEPARAFRSYCGSHRRLQRNRPGHCARVGRRRAYVVLAAQDLARSTAVADAIEGGTKVRRLDMADLASVRASAYGRSGPLNIVINNAGITHVPLTHTVDGFELQLATNYLGAFALTTMLLPNITDRVITVTSVLHRRGSVHLDDLNFTSRRQRPMVAYADSKLCDAVFTVELQRRPSAAGSAVREVAAHPGLANTNLFIHKRGMSILAKPTGVPQQRRSRGAAHALCRHPGHPGRVGGRSEGFGRGPRLSGAKQAVPRTSSTLRSGAGRLWYLSADLTGVDPAGGTH
jgi:NAD(P)-dependent dehydrogenase (short-subunit alcohol dehydrogenase family)